jgi:phosphoglycerate dehydrogenase-like enzyme
LKVLVPDDIGLTALSAVPNVEAIRYDPGAAWPAGDTDAEVVVVNYDNAAATGARFGDLPQLRLVQTLNAGYEQWLPLLPEGVLLSNGRGAHGGSSAEWVVGALLSIYRDFTYFTEQQGIGRWSPRYTDTLIGKRAVVLGAGDLAENLAARLAPFETEVTLIGRLARPGVRTLDDLPTLLPSTDIVVALLPATAATQRIIDADFLAQLPDGAVVVNAGRGGAVDTDALVAELKTGRLRAALDVTDPEPLPAGHPLWAAPGLLLTPHVAGSTAGSAERAWSVAAQQIDSFVGGGLPPNLVAGGQATPR